MLELVICREGSWEGDECEVRESKGKLEPMKMDQILCWSLDCFQFQWCGYHAEEVGTLHQVTKYSSGPVVTEPWGSRERRNNWRPTPAPCQNDQSVDKQQHVWTAATCMNCNNTWYPCINLPNIKVLWLLFYFCLPNLTQNDLRLLLIHNYAGKEILGHVIPA